jgi:Protein of unknown function (DUF3341)
MTTSTATYGLFGDPESAERGMNALRNAGIGSDKIIVISDEPFDEYSFTKTEKSGTMPWIATAGGLIGGTCGFLLARLTQEAYPLNTGGMPLLSPWPTGIVTYELTMLGAVVATIITLLVTTRLPSWKPRLYDPEVSNGKILIGVVDSSDSTRADIELKLRSAGADEVKSTRGA